MLSVPGFLTFDGSLLFQYGTESSLFQDMQNQWRQAVKQRNPELYIKYGGAFDVEVLCKVLPEVKYTLFV